MQISLFCDYRGYASSKYESLFLALEESFAIVAKKRGAGRIGYGDLAYLKALVYKHAEEISSVPELLRNLARNPVICEMIGLQYDSLPDSSRFYAFLAKTKNSEIQAIHHAAVQSLIGGGVVSLDVLIADSNLNAWLHEYNEVRPHSGKYCYGKTPMQTFIDTLPLAKDKMLQYGNNDIGQ